jgi:hypothetical protein
VGQLERRLRCSRCGNRQVGIVIQPDTRSAAPREHEGPARVTFRDYLAYHRRSRTAASIEARHLACGLPDFDSIVEARHHLRAAGATAGTLSVLPELWRGYHDKARRTG